MPATARNVLTGAGWSAFIFPVLTGICLTAIWQSTRDPSPTTADLGGMLVIVGVMLSAQIGLIFIVVLGIPLAILATRITRRTRNLGINLIAQFAAGAVAGALGLIAYSLFSLHEAPSAPYVATAAAISGVTAASGWSFALIAARFRERDARKAETAVSS